jgi:GntR family transcriptional repressor for pyruvate dehydrogenase complex
MRRHRHEVDDMFEFRQLIESSIVSLATQRRTEADLAELERIGFAPSDGWASVTRWHNRFHDGLAAAAHNPYLQAAYSNIRDRIFAPPLTVDERRIAEMRQVHEFILEAVRDRDSDRAAAAIKLHGHVAIKLHGDTSQLSE